MLKYSKLERLKMFQKMFQRKTEGLIETETIGNDGFNKVLATKLIITLCEVYHLTITLRRGHFDVD